MTIEDKSLLLKDLCARKPYGVKVHLDTGNKSFDTDLVGLTSNNTVIIHDTEKYETIEECFIWNIKPYLRSMSSMTEEEVKEFAALESIDVLGGDIKITIVELSVDAIDWLNKKMFDYRGLIEKGLALEAKEGMYKTE